MTERSNGVLLFPPGLGMSLFFQQENSMMEIYSRPTVDLAAPWILLWKNFTDVTHLGQDKGHPLRIRETILSNFSLPGVNLIPLLQSIVDLFSWREDFFAFALSDLFLPPQVA